MSKHVYSLTICLFMAVTAAAQHPVTMCSKWVATVDSASQQIVLRWSPSPDSNVMGYHICSGMPCVDYDTVFGRLDTSYTCADHSVDELHSYRLHVFDSSFNVSSLTPSFGNMVLEADVPECATAVTCSWSPYTGMPSGVGRYFLQVRLEPFYDDFETFHITDSAGPLSFRFDMAPGVTRAHLRVKAVNMDDDIVSYSNIVDVERRTVDTAKTLHIDDVAYDSLSVTVKLRLAIDTAFRLADYKLWRSVDGRPWNEVTTFHVVDGQEPVFEYTDGGVSRMDSLHCYQLSVRDACNMNERYSNTGCTVVPPVVPPAVAFPNAIVVGSDDNGTFLPRFSDILGDIYELHVYDRFGNHVFSTNDPREGWRPDQSVPQGAYAYFVRVHYYVGIVKTYSGTVIVIK